MKTTVCGSHTIGAVTQKLTIRRLDGSLEEKSSIKRGGAGLPISQVYTQVKCAILAMLSFASSFWIDYFIKKFLLGVKHLPKDAIYASRIRSGILHTTMLG